MEHEFVSIDGININATHLLDMDHDQAVKELLAQDQLPGKNETEKKTWIAEALKKAKTELDLRAETRKKNAEALKAEDAKKAGVVEPQQPKITNVAPGANK